MPTTTNQSFTGDFRAQGHLMPLCEDFQAMAGQLFDLVGMPPHQVSDLERQVLSAFGFGMACAEGRARRLTSEELHTLIVSMLGSIFGYSETEAIATASFFMNTASRSDTEHPTVKKIIQRGFEGHAQWQDGDTPRLQANLDTIFQSVGVYFPALSSAEIAAWDDTSVSMHS